MSQAILSIHKLDCGLGPAGGAWVLHDPDGCPLMIGHHGCVAPTRRAAREEAERRVAQDGYTGYTG